MRIELQHVTKRYGALKALDDVSIVVEPGQILALLGANGAGKTTMLRALSGVVGLDRGTIAYDGEEFRRGRVDLRRCLHFLPDFPAVFEHWTPLQHMGMLLRVYGADSAKASEPAVDLLGELDLLPVAEAPFSTLSRGQRYKAALAAMLLVNPPLWLLDEPFASGMDPHGINVFKRRAREAVANGAIVIYSTQILDAAERFSDQVCVIHSGQVRAFGPISGLREHASGGMSALDAIFSRLREEQIT